MKRWLILSVFWSTAVFADDKIIVLVEGMTCPACAGKVEHELKSNTEVKKTKIDIASGTIQIYLEDEKDIGDDKIRNAISKAGYSVKEIKR